MTMDRVTDQEWYGRVEGMLHCEERAQGEDWLGSRYWSSPSGEVGGGWLEHSRPWHSAWRGSRRYYSTRAGRG